MAETQDRPALWRLRQIICHPVCGWGIVILGIVFRLRRYLEDRGLMHDDAQLASNIFSKSFGQLLHPLDIGDQAAPVGFLILQKCSIELFGHSEWAIRLIPFLAAAIALPVFYVMVRKMAGRLTAVLAVAWMAMAEPLVRYSAEGKQYSTDVLWATIALSMAFAADGPADLAILAIVGAVLIWFSHPILFVLGGIGLSLLIKHLRQRNPMRVRADVVMGIVWLASFGVNYLLISRFYVANDFLRQYWEKQSAFAPLPISLHGVVWYPQTILGLFNYPLGIQPNDTSNGHLFVLVREMIVLVAAAVFALGCFVMERRWKRPLGYMVMTILLVLAASSLHRYPFAERLSLFCTPLIILPLAFALGVDAWWRNEICAILFLLICSILFVYPAYIQAKYLVHPEVRYDAKPAIGYVKEHWQTGDALYLHWGSNVLGNYYLAAQPALVVPKGDLIDGAFEPDRAQSRQKYADDLLPLQGRARVWIVFSMDPTKDRAMYEDILDHRGKRIDRRVFNGGATELYDLR